LTVQCFDTFRGFLHKLYAATMDGKGREGTYIFSHDDWGIQGTGHRAQGGSCSLLPCWRRPCEQGEKPILMTDAVLLCYVLQINTDCIVG